MNKRKRSYKELTLAEQAAIEEIKEYEWSNELIGLNTRKELWEEKVERDEADARERIRQEVEDDIRASLEDHEVVRKQINLRTWLKFITFLSLFVFLLLALST